MVRNIFICIKIIHNSSAAILASRDHGTYKKLERRKKYAILDYSLNLRWVSEYLSLEK